MPALQVRDFPDELYEQLKECAARNHRSIAQQTIAYVEQGMSREGTEREFQVIRGGKHASGEKPRSIYVPRRDSEEERAARIAKRKAAFEDIKKLPWNGPLPVGDEIVEMIRESREERTNQILENTGFFEELRMMKDGAQ